MDLLTAAKIEGARKMSIPKDFDCFLQEKFMADNPCILDDDIADAFDDWCTEQDPAMLIQWANQYSNFKYKQGIIHGMSKAKECFDRVMDKL
jgi:hypothetical protein